MILDEMDDYDVYDDVVMNLYDELSKEVWKSKVPCYGCLHLKSMSATAKDS